MASFFENSDLRGYRSTHPGFCVTQPGDFNQTFLKLLDHSKNEDWNLKISFFDAQSSQLNLLRVPVPYTSIEIRTWIRIRNSKSTDPEDGSETLIYNPKFSCTAQFE